MTYKPFEDFFRWRLPKECMKAKWFKKGQESVKRKNQSGCCCIINDADEIESVCGAHKEWAEAIRKDEQDRIVEMLKAEREIKLGFVEYPDYDLAVLDGYQEAIELIQKE